MALHRYTIKQLETFSDLEMLRGVIADRMSTCTNIYAPLYRRLQGLYSKVDRLIQSEKRFIAGTKKEGRA